MPELRTPIFLLTPTPNYATSHSAVSSVMFFDRNTSMSTDVASRLARRLLTISSALEYSLSEGTEVDGIPKYFSARCTSLGYMAKVSFHHIKELELMSSGGTLSRRKLHET